MQGKLIYGIGGILIGLVAGFFAANAINRQSAATSSADMGNTASTVSPQPPGTTAQPGGMQEDVAKTLEKAETEPNNFAAQMLAGDMYAQIRRFDKAVEFYKRGVALNGENIQANIVLANALFDSQKFEDAEAYYSKALQIDPQNVNARTDLGTTFVERKLPDYDRAIGEFNKALELDPKNATAIYYLGIAQFRKGDKAAAEKALQDLEKADPAGELAGRLRQNISGGGVIR